MFIFKASKQETGKAILAIPIYYVTMMINQHVLYKPRFSFDHPFPVNRNFVIYIILSTVLGWKTNAVSDAVFFFFFIQSQSYVFSMYFKSTFNYSSKDYLKTVTKTACLIPTSYKQGWYDLCQTHTQMFPGHTVYNPAASTSL